MKLFPLKFNPVYSYRIWGGEKLKTVLNKDYKQESIGESWEISDVDKNETLVSGGDLKGYSLKMLIQEFKGDFVGNSVYEKFVNDFPLLIKFIDAPSGAVDQEPDWFKKERRVITRNEKVELFK